MSNENTTGDMSRRSLLKTAGIGLTATPLAIGGFSGSASASLPYDVIQNNDGYTTIRYTKNSLYHNLIKLSVSSTVEHFGPSVYTDDDRWNHKFGIDTQGIAYHTDADELRPNIGDHGTKIQKISDGSLEINGKPVGSGYVGATPADSYDEVDNVFTTALTATASLLSAKFAVASSATAIANSLVEAGTEDCDTSPDCAMYEWTYFSDKKEVAHQTKWWMTTGPDEWSNAEVMTEVDSDVGISFALSVGPDYADIAGYEPPSSVDSVQTETTTENGPAYVTREDLKEFNSRADSNAWGIPRPHDMSAEAAQRYGVRKLDTPQNITVNGKSKTATHVATDIPVHVMGLEPPIES